MVEPPAEARLRELIGDLPDLAKLEDCDEMIDRSQAYGDARVNSLFYQAAVDGVLTADEVDALVIRHAASPDLGPNFREVAADDVAAFVALYANASTRAEVAQSLRSALELRGISQEQLTDRMGTDALRDFQAFIDGKEAYLEGLQRLQDAHTIDIPEIRALIDAHQWYFAEDLFHFSVELYKSFGLQVQRPVDYGDPEEPEFMNLFLSQGADGPLVVINSDGGKLQFQISPVALIRCSEPDRGPVDDETLTDFINDDHIRSAMLFLINNALYGVKG